MIQSNHRKPTRYVTLESRSGDIKYSYIQSSKTPFPLTPSGLVDLTNKIKELETDGYLFVPKSDDGAEKLFAIYNFSDINSISLYTYILDKTFKAV